MRRQPSSTSSTVISTAPQTEAVPAARLVLADKGEDGSWLRADHGSAMRADVVVDRPIARHPTPQRFVRGCPLMVGDLAGVGRVRGELNDQPIGILDIDRLAIA